MARTKHDVRSEATRRRLVTAARTLFGARGYADVGTEEIVRAAGVTRGALYHQFRDKADLFAAVAEEVEAEIAERIAGAAGVEADPVGALRAGARLFLDACAEPEVERIILLDAPAVLGWEAWRDLAAGTVSGWCSSGCRRRSRPGPSSRSPSPPSPMSSSVRSTRARSM